MNGPALTPQEAVAAVARRVRRLEAHNLDRDQAIRLTAYETGMDAEKVRWCATEAAESTPAPESFAVETAPVHSTVRLAPSRRRRRRQLAVAAAL
jgi:hypothetical protein